MKNTKKQLKELKTKMFKAQEFAEKLPLFKDYIIKNMIIEKDSNRLGDRYKSLYLSCGINRSKYVSGSNRYVTNLNKDYNETLTSIYINFYSLFNTNNQYGLDELDTNIFFYDRLNSTFYATDKQIELLLETLNIWYLNALELFKAEKKKRKRKS